MVAQLPPHAMVLNTHSAWAPSVNIIMAPEMIGSAIIYAILILLSKKVFPLVHNVLLEYHETVALK